jgi:hypothetical protein
LPTYEDYLKISSNPILAQELTSVKARQTTPERAAEGQTKWMMSQLKLDESHFKTLYNINLKYQVKTDSVHLSTMVLTSKRESYLLYDQIRNEELKKVLSPDLYDKYQMNVESMKARAKTINQ